jgi:hypothetical protein
MSGESRKRWTCVCGFSSDWFWRVVLHALGCGEVKP